MQSAMTGSYFVFWYLIRGRFNVESLKSAYNFILEIMDFFPSLALAWSLSDQTAESEVTVGCARPVNPLKLSPTLSTLNFRTCDHENTTIKKTVFTSIFLCLMTTIFHLSDFWGAQLKEKRCLIEIYILIRRWSLALNIVRLDQFPRLIYLLLNTLSAARWKVDRLQWEFDCFDWPLWWL
jgi:hypothetical protein